MKMSNRGAVVLTTLLLIAAAPKSSLALNESTHQLVNKQAATSSQLDTVLRNSLGIQEGVLARFRDRNGVQNDVLDWLGEGGKQEDQGTVLDLLLGRARYLRHFHDPLQPWDQAGLRLGPLQFKSALRWMQDPDQATSAVGGSWAWQDAREHYRKALTSADPRTREQEFADLFRALGQLMHLVTDTSVPEHTRNDIHVAEGICRTFGARCYGSYEYWISDQHGLPGSPEEAAFIADFLSSPFGPDPAILQRPTGDSVASVPIALLIDTNIYQGLATGPNVTLGRAIGIAEVANANFFSEDTGGGQYPYPNVTTLQRIDLLGPTGRIRAYFAKGPNDGLAVAPVLAECVLYQPAADGGVVEPVVRNCTDELVWAQVADQMLPRAVGYSATLLDYFFRGILWTGMQSNRLTITNGTPGERMEGPFMLYYQTPDGTLVPLAGGTLALEPGEASEFQVPVPPQGANPVSCLIVFRGQLGLEPDAIAGSVVACPTEPPPPPPPPPEWITWWIFWWIAGTYTGPAYLLGGPFTATTPYPSSIPYPTPLTCPESIHGYLVQTCGWTWKTWTWDAAHPPPSSFYEPPTPPFQVP